jgi:hypothetical protein
MVKLKRTEGAKALQIVDVSHWQLDFINSYHFVFKVQNDTILLHGFDTKNEVILWLIVLVNSTISGSARHLLLLEYSKKFSSISALCLV